MALKLHTIICSTRPSRVGPKVAHWFHEYAGNHGKFDAKLVDLAEFELPVFDEAKHPRMQDYAHEHTRRWSKSVSAADAFVFVLPEYDYFPPSSFVNAVQFLSLEWNYKPAGIVSYGGISGGLRSAQIARSLLSNLKVVAIPEGVPVPLFSQFIGDDDVFKPSDAIAGGAKVVLDELHKWADALKPMRVG